MAKHEHVSRHGRGARKTPMTELETIIAEASARQRKRKHHHKPQTIAWSASAEDHGTQMTTYDNPNVGRKYLTDRQAVELWERRTDRLESGRSMLQAGAGVRQPHKAKNKFSKEEMGTLPTIVGVCRFSGSYITKACYRRNMY